MLRWVLDRQTATLLVAVATLALTVWLYIVIPKGFFPVQDTGLIQGISEAPQSISFAAMAERQQALAEVILKDPDVESLSSFIGVDGTNITLNSGRFLINLKPHDKRDRRRRRRSSARITRATAGGRRHLALPAAGAGPHHRRRGEPHAVSVLARGRQPGGARGVGAAPRRQAQLDAAVLPGVERHLGLRPDRLYRHRPRHRRPLRHHAGDHRQRALRLVRPAHRLDDLHQLQPVPRDPGDRSEAAGVARFALLDLPPDLDQQRLGPGQVPLSAVATRARGHGAAADRPPRPVSRRPRSRSTSARAIRSARRSTRSSRRARRSACRSAPTSACRARRWRSRHRCRTSCC